MLTKREQIVMDLLQEYQQVSVERISEHLQVSTVTTRKILDKMANVNLLRRIHGGAVLMDNEISIPNFSHKETLYKKEKKKIAKTALSYIDSNQTIFCNGGTTTLELIKIVPHKKINCIITNNASATHINTSLEGKLIFTGGVMNNYFNSFYGEMTQLNLQNIYADIMFLGTTGIDVEKGITTPVINEAIINNTMIKNTKGKVYALCDSSKIGVVSNYVVAPIDDVDTIITDDNIPTTQREQIKKRGINLVIAE